LFDIELESPRERDKLCRFMVRRIENAEERIHAIVYLLSNEEIWARIKAKIGEGIDVKIVAPPITHYDGASIPEVFKIYKEATYLSQKNENFEFYVCPIWWQKEPMLRFARTLLWINYYLHAKLWIIDDFIYLPSSNFDSKMHFDTVFYTDDTTYVKDAEKFTEDIIPYSVDASTLSLDLRKRIGEATRMTLESSVMEQLPYNFRKLHFVAPFYEYKPRNFVRRFFHELLDTSDEYIYGMFQHFMTDVKEWSEPKAPGIVKTLCDKREAGVTVKMMAAGGETNPAAIRDKIPALQSCIRKNPKVHAKFFCTDQGFLIGSMNINPTSFYHTYYPTERKIVIDPAIHLLCMEYIPKQFVHKEYGVILQRRGYKSTIEILTKLRWDESTSDIQQELEGYFERSWT